MPNKKKLAVVSYQDPSLCLTPGLFRSEKRGVERKELNVSYQINDTDTIQFRGNALGIRELRILQALAAMAYGQKQTVAVSGAHTDDEKQLLLLFDFEGSKDGEVIRLKGTYQELLRHAGYESDSGDARENVEEGLSRLAAVTYFLRRGTKMENPDSSKIIAFKLDSGTRQFEVALYPRLTRAILGQGRFVAIDMDEVRALKSDAARLLHNRLSAIVDQGKHRRFLLETLLSYVWPAPATGSTLRMRRKTLREAMKDIQATGSWLFTSADGQLYVVHRRGAGDPAFKAPNQAPGGPQNR